MFKNEGSRRSAYQQAADAILKQLEEGTIPWRKPWSSGFPTNATTRKMYRGINVFILGARQMPSQYWLTYRQAALKGGHVMAGQKGTHILFFSRTTSTKHNDETGEDEVSKYGFWRMYTVFNLTQCNPELAEKLGLADTKHEADIPAAQAIWEGYKDRPPLEDSDAAWYNPPMDKIGMPPQGKFQQLGEYYSTLFHEMIHSTGASKRLDREGVTKSTGIFGGKEDYSQEELVAEFGSAMLCGMCGLEKAVLGNQAAYIQTWLKRLRMTDGNKALISAVSAAQKACDHILPAIKEVPQEQEAE
jgi:antirestriction protein ArdC